MSATASISDLPVELLEKIASHLDPNTINSLKCVDKYFNRAFNNDRVWKRYLYFIDKYFLCDLRSDSELPALQEVFREISGKEIGKWLGYYKLQRAHIQNWVCGRNQNFYSISLCPDNVSQVEEFVSEDYKHWLFFGSHNGICAWDITGRPRSLVPFLIGPHSKMRLLPGGKLLIRDHSFSHGDCLMAVYQFDSTTFSLNLLFKFVFYMDEILHTSMEPPNKLLLFNFRYIVIKDLFVGYTKNVSNCQGCHLHLWDLSTGMKLAKISLNEYEVLKKFANLIHSNTENRINIFHNSHGCFIDLHEGEYPNIIVVLKYPHAMVNQVSIFNVKTMQFSHVVDQVQCDVQLCSMYSDKVCMEEVISTGEETVWRASIYQVGSAAARRLRYITSSATRYLGSAGAIVFNKSKVLVKTENEVHVVSLDTDPIHHIQIGVTPSYRILGFMKPKLLLMYDLHQNPTSTTVKVYNALSGVELCSWDRVNTSRDRFMHYFTNLEYPSKLVLSLKGEPEFKVFYF